MSKLHIQVNYPITVRHAVCDHCGELVTGTHILDSGIEYAVERERGKQFTRLGLWHACDKPRCRGAVLDFVMTMHNPSD